MHRDGPLPRAIELGSISKVLDVGAGTLVWTLDVAGLPEVKSRILPIVSDSSSVHLYATDITDEMFPPSHELEALGITTFVHDLTTPFPQDLHGTFDLVHMRLVCSALSMEGWRKSLKHIYSVLSMFDLCPLLPADHSVFRARGYPHYLGLRQYLVSRNHTAHRRI